MAAESQGLCRNIYQLWVPHAQMIFCIGEHAFSTGQWHEILALNKPTALEANTPASQAAGQCGTTLLLVFQTTFSYDGVYLLTPCLQGYIMAIIVA